MDIQGMCAEALEQVVREVAARVVASIKAQQDQALVVYTGAKIGYATATEQLAQLRERLGLSYTVLMSEPAARVLDVDAIDEALKPAALVIERSGSKSAESMARDAGMIIVPALTANSCAHVAGCMTDSAAQAAIVEGIGLGRDVVASINGCCPDNADRVNLGFSFPAPMAARMRENMEVLRSYGVNLTTSEGLAAKVERVRARRLSALLGQGVTGVSACDTAAQACAPVAPSPRQAEFAGHVVGAQTLSALPENSTLLIAPDALVTSLAQDVAARRSITIVKNEREARA